eukprot:XP_015581226.1 acetylserotonin O-methyltransferase [Ricinus communis]
MENTRRSDSTIRDEEEEEEEADVEIWKYVLGFSKIAAVKCAVELGLADAIESNEAPMTLFELSSTLGCAPSSLYRIMRFPVHQKIFKEKPTSQGTTGYEQTPLSRRLLRQGENSMADFILMESSPDMLAPWQCLSNRVRGNIHSAFEESHGQHLWKHTEANPAHSKLFNDAMACDARIIVPSIIEVCPEVFNGVKSVVDVGGGNGTTLGLLVKASPWIQGINFDLPHVVSVALECDGVKHVGGDMFDSVPQADAAFLMWVLHDWNDDECIQILKKCKEVVPEDNGKVIIVEVVIGEAKDDKLEYVRLMLDMVMMAHTNTGKERASKEWESVIQKAGFRSHTIKTVGAMQSIIVVAPACGQ